MARADHGPLGPIKGKVKNLIFSSNLGTPYVRSNPGSRAEGNTKEKNTRNGFGEASWGFINPIKPFLMISYKEVAKGRRMLQAVMSYLNRYAMERGEDNISSVVPSRMLISRGSLGLPADVQVTLSADRELQFTWDHRSTSGPYHNDDQVLLMAYNLEASKAAYSIGPTSRPTGAASLPLGDLPAGKAHVYLGFISQDRTKASNSVYLGEVEV